MPVPQVKIDSVEILNAQEKLGVVVHLEKKIHVSGLSYMDHTILWQALAQVGIPAVMSSLTAYPSLVLTERNTALVDSDKVDITLVYEHFMNVEQDADNPLDGYSIYGDIKASTQQVTTNKNLAGEMILVKHTYSSDPADDNYDPELGDGIEKQQTGEIQVFSPMATASYKFIKKTNTPWLIRAALEGMLNLNAWNGAIRSWLCTAVNFTLHDLTGPVRTYKFSVEFQYNPDGWDPTVVFIDSRTGRPPAGLVDGDGYFTVLKLPMVDFATVLGVELS